MTGKELMQRIAQRIMQAGLEQSKEVESNEVEISITLSKPLKHKLDMYMTHYSDSNLDSICEQVLSRFLDCFDF